MTALDISSSWGLLCTLSLLTLLWIWTKLRNPYVNSKIPPFPSRPWSVVGHFFCLFGNLRDKLKELRRAGGDIYSLIIGPELHILVNDFKDIKEIWIKQADRIVNTHVNLGDEILQEYNKGIISARDDNWKEQRTTSLSILRSFGMGKNIMATKIQEEVFVIIEKLASLEGNPADVRLLLNISVSNVICSVAVGTRFEHEDPYFVGLIGRVNEMVKYFTMVALLTPFKQLSYLPGDLFNVKKWTEASIAINEMFSKKFVKKLKESYGENEEPENFVAAYLQEMTKAENKGTATNLSEDNLIALIRTLFLAGTETTSTTVLWCLLYMLHYPDIQEKVFLEIETVIGTERTPNMTDRPKMTYLNAVIMETQRVASLVPIGIRREVSETFEYGGYFFPKGSILWPVLDSVHFEKKIWGDPEKFRPERFIDGNGDLINREELIPFSIGRRSCLGEALARMELFLFLSNMFQRFKFAPADKSGELPTLKESFGGTVVPHPYKLRFIDRKV